jgi:hypothetical protein
MLLILGLWKSIRLIVMELGRFMQSRHTIESLEAWFHYCIAERAVVSHPVCAPRKETKAG